MADPVKKSERSKYTPKNLNGGRPKMFPDQPTKKKVVTLPASTWEYILSIDPSLSRAIFEIANQHQIDNS